MPENHTPLSCFKIDGLKSASKPTQRSRNFIQKRIKNQFKKLKRKTLFFIEQQFKAEGYEQLIEKKEWKQKKSFIRNLHIISYKNKKTQKQKNLNKLLENQTNGLEDYMDLYMNYTSQSYGAVYEEYRINRCQFKQMLISIIILILFMIIGICANRSVQKSAAQKRQEQQQERYVDGLKKSVKVQKSNQ